jgi:hypothetical protein
VRTVYIVISCDTDPDRAGFLDGIPPGGLAWRGASEGIPAVKDLVGGLTDSKGGGPVFTWLLRADDQIRQVHGAYAWFARTHGSLLRALQESGDELGWHPHFWRRETETGRWFQEVEDVDWQVDMLHQAHRDLSACLPGPPRSVRMGWAYHNNRTYHALEDLGLAADFSAIPGLRTFTGKPPARGENFYDWYPTPRTPYRPSRADYRRARRGQEGSRRVLEVPSFVSTSRLWALVGALQLARKTGDAAQLWYAVRRPSYYINVTARPVFFAPIVADLRKALRRRDGGPLVFETHFHPDELVPNRSRLYNLESVRTNLDSVVRACQSASTPVEFVQACRVAALWPDGDDPHAAQDRPPS